MEVTLHRYGSQLVGDWRTGCWMMPNMSANDSDLNMGGYSQFFVGGDLWLGHRLSYVWFHGGHDQGLTVDHVCGRRMCVAPAHLDAVSRSNNTKRRDTRQAAMRDGWGWIWSLFTLPSPLADRFGKLHGLPIERATWDDFAKVAALFPVPYDS